MRRQGVSQEFLGCTEGIRGGGFIYTQTETLSVGLVCHLDSLKKRGIAPYDLFRAVPCERPVGSCSRARSWSSIPPTCCRRAATIVPRLSTGGLLLAGDAAGLCYTNGLNQEGMNLAMTSGFLAAETAVEALRQRRFSSASGCPATKPV